MLTITQAYKAFTAEGPFMKLAEKALTSVTATSEQQRRTALAQELESLTASLSKIPVGYDKSAVHDAVQRVIGEIGALNKQA